MKQNAMILTIVGILISVIAPCQTKKQLKEQLLIAEQRAKESQIQLDRISNIQVDDVITPDKQPKDIVIGESGWRIELNGLKYKSDIIGQLGTIWIADVNNQLQPQGTISLADYKIDPLLINPDKEVVYKSFISKGTKLDGEGSISFVKITGALKANQFSSFTINIEGTSLIKPKFADLKKSAEEVAQLFTINASKGIFICTGMHVVRYHSSVYAKSEGATKITSPVVNIGGDFYAESSEESSEYLVVRQLTQLFKPANKDSIAVKKDITALSQNPSLETVKLEGTKYSPEQVLTYFLKRQPTFDEITTFQSNPNSFIEKHIAFKLTNQENAILNIAKSKIIDLPSKLKSLDK